MKITFYIPHTSPWNRAHALVLAREQVSAGYRVRIIDAQYQTTVSEDGVTFVQPPLFAKSKWFRAVWVFWYFATRRRGIVHAMGVTSGLIALILRAAHPASRLILHVDDISDIPHRFSVALSIRLAHTRVTSRKDLLRHEAFAKYSLQYIPYAMHTQGQVIDPSVLRANGLELQQFFLAYVHPACWSDLQNLVKDWRNSVRALLPHAKLAIIFTEDIPSQHIAFGHDVVILGAVTPYTEQMLKAGARAVLVPSLSQYRLQILAAMAMGKYAVPLRELMNRNPFALEELADMYRAPEHDVTDIQDAALTMSWGHIARTVIATEHSPSEIALQYEDLYGQLLFADKVTAKARLS